MNKPLTSRLLGYPADARLLILNADDFSVCHSIIRALLAGPIRSTTLMTSCPEEGIILLDYRALQPFWKVKQSI